MYGSLRYPSFTRLLALNNQVHDLENRLLAEPVRVPSLAGPGRVAELQDEIDRGTRATLALCWLADLDR